MTGNTFGKLFGAGAVLLGIGLLPLAGSATPAAAAAGDSVVLSNGWTFTDLGAGLPDNVSTHASDINDSGVVVGTVQLLDPEPHDPSADHVSHAAAFVGGQVVKLDSTAHQTYAGAISNSGRIVGGEFLINFTDCPRALEFTGGHRTDLGCGQADAINEAGQVVGRVYLDGVGPAGGQFVGPGQLLPTYKQVGTNPNPGFARDINESGQIVGTQFVPHSDANPLIGDHSFRFDTDPQMEIAPGRPDFRVNGISDNGVAVGRTGAGNGAVVVGGVLTDLGRSPSGAVFEFFDVNDHGVAVGGGGFESPGAQGVVYDGHTLQAVDDWMPDASEVRIETLNAVNELGQIVGDMRACSSNDCYTHAIRLDPPGFGVTTTTTTTEASSTTSTTSEDSSTTSTSTSTTIAGPSVKLSSSSVRAGESLTVSGSGFAPNVAVQVELHSDPVALGFITAKADGTFSGSIKIPANTAVGAHQIVVNGTKATGGNASVAVDVTVVAKLPVTGSDARDRTLLALGLIGIGLVVLGRSRLALPD